MTDARADRAAPVLAPVPPGGLGASEAELSQAMALGPNEASAFAQAVSNLINYQLVAEVPDRIATSTTTMDTNIQWWLERMVRATRP